MPPKDEVHRVVGLVDEVHRVVGLVAWEVFKFNITNKTGEERWEMKARAVKTVGIFFGGECLMVWEDVE